VGGLTRWMVGRKGGEVETRVRLRKGLTNGLKGAFRNTPRRRVVFW